MSSELKNSNNDTLSITRGSGGLFSLVLRFHLLYCWIQPTGTWEDRKRQAIDKGLFRLGDFGCRLIALGLSSNTKCAILPLVVGSHLTKSVDYWIDCRLLATKVWQCWIDPVVHCWINLWLRPQLVFCWVLLVATTVLVWATVTVVITTGKCCDPSSYAQTLDLHIFFIECGCHFGRGSSMSKSGSLLEDFDEKGGQVLQWRSLPITTTRCSINAHSRTNRSIS